MRHIISIIVVNILILVKPSYRFSTHHRQNETLIYRLVNTVRINQTLSIRQSHINAIKTLNSIYDN